MIYSIHHVTNYSYEFPVSSATLSLRVKPRSDIGQRCLDHSMTIFPQPDTSRVDRDFFGNAVTTATIETGLTSLRIEARARVEVSRRPAPPPGSSPDWREIADQVFDERSLGSDAPAHFICASPRVALSQAVTAYAAQSFQPERPIVDGARDLAKRIRADFVYSPKVTDVSTPLDQAFAQRQGVCQDFAHVMIAGLRGLGLPAAYVSGYLRTTPLPGNARLEGADATHAWVSVWCGADLGWFGFDPTNAIDIGDDHIVLAVGRDFSDVSPVYGVFVGSGAQELDVGVEVTPVDPAG